MSVVSSKGGSKVQYEGNGQNQKNKIYPRPYRENRFWRRILKIDFEIDTRKEEISPEPVGLQLWGMLSKPFQITSLAEFLPFTDGSFPSLGFRTWTFSS